MEFINNENKKILIAISGRACAGKNTVATMISDHFGFTEDKTKIVALADPMKRILKSIFPEASEECLYGPSELRSTIIADKYRDKQGGLLSYRQALIDLGAFGRQYNPDIWLNCLIEDIRNSTDKSLYLIGDVRFVNEFRFLKKAGFIMIRVVRDNISYINDESETQQELILNSEFDYIIDNNGTLNNLSETIKSIVLKISGTYSYNIGYK